MDECHGEDKPQCFSGEAGFGWWENERGKYEARPYMQERTAKHWEEWRCYAILWGKEYFEEGKTDTKENAEKKYFLWCDDRVFGEANGILAQKEIFGNFFNTGESKEGECGCKCESEGLVNGSDGWEENKFKNKCEATREGTENEKSDEGHRIKILPLERDPAKGGG